MSKVKKALLPALFATLVLALTGAFVSMKPLQASAQNQGNMQITLTDGIIVKYYAELAQGTQSATAVFDSTVNSLDDTVTGTNTEGNTWEFIYTKVTPQYVDQDFNITVNGTSMVTDYSVADYLASVIAKDDATAEEIAVAKDLIYYGQAAKAYVDETYTMPVDAVQGTAYAGEVTTLDLTGKDTYSDVNNRIETATVVFDNVPAIKFYFAKASQDVVVKVEGENVTDKLTQEGGLYVYTQTGIFATDFDKKYTVTFTNGTYVQTLNYSINDYATRMAVSTNANVTDDMKTLAKALWSYGVGAEALWTANNNTENPNPGEVTLVGIELKNDTKTDYDLGEAWQEGALVLNYDNNSAEEIPLTVEMLTGFDTAMGGKKSVTVTYEGFETTFDIRVGYDATSNTYRLGNDLTTYKVQVEDESFSDLSGLTGYSLVNETTAGDKTGNGYTRGDKYPNGAEGTSTFGAIKGTQYLRFYAEKAGAYHIGISAQALGTNGTNGWADISKLSTEYSMTVNGVPTTLTDSKIPKAATKGQASFDLTLWTKLDDISGVVYIQQGVNVITFSRNALASNYLGIDYFTVTAETFYEDVSIEVTGETEFGFNSAYNGEWTLTVKEGGEEVGTVPVVEGMLQGFDTSTLGTHSVTVSYLGASTVVDITVVNVAHTVTLVGGKFTDTGLTTAQLYYGDTIPAITWDIAEKEVFYYLAGGQTYSDCTGLTMGAEDMTIEAVTTPKGSAVGFFTDNSRTWANKGFKTGGATPDDMGIGDLYNVSGNTCTKTSVYGTNDGASYSMAQYKNGSGLSGTSKGDVKGVTWLGAQNLIKSTGTEIYVTFTNTGSVALEDFYFVMGNADKDYIYFGDVAAGETVKAMMVIDTTIAANNAWFRPSICFSNTVTELNFTISVYLNHVA